MSQKSILYTSLSREPHSHSKRERRSGDHGANGDGIAEPYLYESEEYPIHLLYLVSHTLTPRERAIFFGVAHIT